MREGVVALRDALAAAGGILDRSRAGPSLLSLGILGVVAILILPVPPALLRLAARAAGRADAAQRLLGSLCVDAGALRAALGWTPPQTLAQGLADTVRAWRAAAGRA